MRSRQRYAVVEEKVCCRIQKGPIGWIGPGLMQDGVGVVGVQLAEEAGGAEAYRPEASFRVEE